MSYPHQEYPTSTNIHSITILDFNKFKVSVNLLDMSMPQPYPQSSVYPPPYPPQVFYLSLESPQLIIFLDL